MLLPLLSSVSAATGEVYLLKSNIPLKVSHEYRLTFRARSDQTQELTVMMQNIAGTQISLNDTAPITIANRWQNLRLEFTALETNKQSQLRVYPEAIDQTLYLDNFNLIDLTNEQKIYRVMRIQGSILPGSFVQSLTLREKTTAETA